MFARKITYSITRTHLIIFCATNANVGGWQTHMSTNRRLKLTDIIDFSVSCRFKSLCADRHTLSRRKLHMERGQLM